MGSRKAVLKCYGVDRITVASVAVFPADRQQ